MFVFKITASAALGLSAALTFGCRASAHQCQAYSASGAVTGTTGDQRQMILNNFGAQIWQTSMNQRRIITEDMPQGLGETMLALPPGSNVVDLGAGYGITVASAVLGNDLQTQDSQGRYDRNRNPSALDFWRQKLAHLNFLGITATPADQMLVPLIGPGGRWRLLPERLLEDIPDSEIQSLLGGRPTVAFSKFGVFEYTPTPDLAFRKFHAFPIGSKLFLNNYRGNIYVSPTGEELDIGEYAKRCEFKVTKMIAYIDRNHPEKPLILEDEHARGAMAVLSRANAS